MGEVITQNQIKEVLGSLKTSGKKIVVTNGCFDILHVGHVKYLQKSKSFGDILIVLLNSDKSVKLSKELFAKLTSFRLKHPKNKLDSE